MTASTKPKTPSMTIPVRKGVSHADIELFCKKATRLNLSQLVDRVAVQEQLTAQGASRRKEYTVQMTLFPADEYREEHSIRPAAILGAIATAFAEALTKEITLEIKKLGEEVKQQMKQVGKGRVARADADGAGAEDGEEGEGPTRRQEEEGSDHGDGDAEDDKRARQSRQQATYESDEDEDVEEVDENRMIEDAYADGTASDDESAPGATAVNEGAISEDRVSAAQRAFEERCSFLTEFAFAEDQCTFKLEVGGRTSDAPAEADRMCLDGRRRPEAAARRYHRARVREDRGPGDSGNQGLLRRQGRGQGGQRGTASHVGIIARH
jgi:hypothetical protein